MKDIFVVTHAEATHHLEGTVGGWHDSELTPRGVMQAERTVGRLAQLVGNREAEIYSSDLRRAVGTAAAVESRLGGQVLLTPALREISYGVAGGRPEAWLDARYSPAPDNDRLDHDCGVESAETRRDVARRVFPFIDEIVARPAGVQILVTHGFTLSLVIAAWMRIPVDASGFISFTAPTASITHLRQDDFFRNRALVSLGDIAHLA